MAQVVTYSPHLHKPRPLGQTHTYFDRIRLAPGDNRDVDVESLKAHPDYSRYAALGVLQVTDRPDDEAIKPAEEEPKSKSKREIHTLKGGI